MGSRGDDINGHEAKLATIDVSPLLSSTSSDKSKDAVLEALRLASTTHGFFVITGHGIPLTVQQHVLGNAKKFFNLPLTEKKEVSTANSYRMAYRGYEEMSGQAIEVGGHPDLKEGFIIGSEIPKTDPRAGAFLLGPNQWPSNLDGDDFKGPLMDYHGQVSDLLQTLLEALASTVPQYFSAEKARELMSGGESTLRLLHYPPRNPAVDGQFGAAAHADLSCLTILLQEDGVAGLEVWSEEKEIWIPAPAIEDALVVNIGNVFQTLTDGYFKSARHRVLNGNSHHRYSAALFYYGTLNAEFTPSRLTLDSLPSRGKAGLVANEPTTVTKYVIDVIITVKVGEEM